MKTSKLALAIAGLMTLGLVSCRSTKTLQQPYTYTSNETVCLGVGHDGTEKLRAWGKGTTKAEAIEQAKKNAVHDVIFRGITSGGGCDQRPLVKEVNAEERYREYFTRFFANGGEYQNFVKEDSNHDQSRIESKGLSQTSYGIVVTVEMEALRNQLIADGVVAVSK